MKRSKTIREMSRFKTPKITTLNLKKCNGAGRSLLSLLHTTIINVLDLEKSVRFYREALQRNEVRRNNRFPTIPL